MSVNDPLSDMLTRLRNATARQKDAVVVPWTKVCEATARVLLKENYLKSVEVKGNEMTLELSPEKIITHIERVSKPGVRRYVRVPQIQKVLSGLGILVISTPKGIMSGKNARQNHLGGEVICKIW